MRPKGRWTGVQPAKDREGYFEVVWPTHELSNSKGIKKATHVAPDLWELFKTLGVYFEEQGEKYYTQKELDEQVSAAVDSALASAPVASVASIGFKPEIDGLKDRVEVLEEKVNSPVFQLPETAYKLSDEERLKHWGPTVCRMALLKAIPNHPDDEEDTNIFDEAVDEAGAYLLIDKKHPLRRSLCTLASSLSHKIRDKAA